MDSSAPRAGTPPLHSFLLCFAVVIFEFELHYIILIIFSPMLLHLL